MSGLETLKLSLKETVQIVFFVCTMTISFGALNNKLDSLSDKMSSFQSFEKETKTDDKDALKENLLWRKSIEDRQHATTIQLKLIEQRLDMMEMHKFNH
ncbi:MAG: hypothetical protein EAY81_11975 [Bacteroidetes bacterium]|nr:MAG: hypothetical protein EAY81_11975 [Bacteroidota bacterium]